MKSPRERANDLRQLQRRQTLAAQAQDRLNYKDGLTNATLDINGRVMGGIDSVTGQYRAPSASFVQPSTGLVSGHVGDKSGIGGARDLDPNGGLSGGSTPRMFLESDATKKLRDAPSAEGALASWRGDPAHDPSTRLAQMTGFGNYTKIGGALSSEGRNSLVAAAKRDAGHDTDTAKGKTALDAARAMVDAQDLTNAYLKSIEGQFSNLGLK